MVDQATSPLINPPTPTESYRNFGLTTTIALWQYG
jgi:hypothetical protein